MAKYVGLGVWFGIWVGILLFLVGGCVIWGK